MDTITQFTLGAAVGVAVMGRTQPAWKSAVIGGIAGTLPDLDAFLDHGDPIADMVFHRAETHALFWQALAAPFIALVFALADRSLDLFFRWWVMTLLALVTHSALDAMTVYGTRLLLPLDDTPVAVGSIFIIDPLYTLPLLIGVLVAVLGRERWRWNIAGLLVSTAYLGGTWFAQQHVLRQVMAAPAAAGLARENILITPTAFNAVLWRVVLMRPDRYQEGYVSLLDSVRHPQRAIRFEAFERGPRLEQLEGRFTAAERLAHFSHGFYALTPVAEGLAITDLRMGQNPWYVFSFKFAAMVDGRLAPIRPLAIGNRGDMPIGSVLNWMGQRMLGDDVSPPRAEAAGGRYTSRL